MTLGRPAKRLSPITGTRLQENGQPVAHGNGDAGLVIGRETMQPIHDFVDKHAGRRPFFVSYAPFLPHTPFDAPARFRHLYDAKNVPDNLLPYYAEIARFDETVGELLEYLRRKSLLDNTLIVFASDNGFRPDPDGRPRHNRRSKLSQFEDGLRTPILLCWQGRIQPAEHLQLVHTIDLVPTVLAAVGLPREVTSRMRGRDLTPSAMGRKELVQRPVFGAIYPNDAVVLGQPSRHVRGRWVREGRRFKLIVPGPASPQLPLALYDLQVDPEERSNLADSPVHASRIENMTRLLDQWWPTGDDSGVTPR